MKNNSKRFGTMVIVSSILGLGVSSARADFITNGSFSGTVNNPAGYDGYSAPSTFTNDGAWTVASGTIDYVSTYFKPPSGYSVDLDGTSVGSISQSVGSLLNGHVYTVFFELAANSDGAPDPKKLEVEVSPPTPPTGRNYEVYKVSSAQSGDFVSETFTFKASATTELLTFASMDVSPTPFFGPVIADVSMIETPGAPVPLPKSASVGFSMLGLFGGLAVLRKRLFLNNKIA